MNAMLSSLVSTLGWALIDFLWQGALLGMLAAVALMLLRNARPQTRYAVACAALALCLALPMVGVWRGMHRDETPNAIPATDTPSLLVLSAQPVVVPVMSWRASLQSDLPWIVSLWSLGAGLLALRMSLGMLWVAGIDRRNAGAADARWQARLDRLATGLGIGRGVRLRVVGDLDSPVAAGCWRPMVLVPAMLITRMPPDLLEALLAHELAHIRRHDYLLNLLQSAIEALLFYHPVVWWLSHRIRIEREQIADDLAAGAIGEPRRLALALNALDQFQLDASLVPSAHLVPAATGGDLMSRIQRLIRPSQHVLSWKLSLPILGLTAVCLTVYAQGATPPIAKASVVATSTTIRPATPAAAEAPKKWFGTSARSVDGYAVVRAGTDGLTMSGDSRDIPAIKKARQSIRGDFVWIRRGDKTYVVQDPALLARVVDIQNPVEALDAQMNLLDAKMEGPNRQMEALNRQMEALNDERATAAMEKTGAQMEALGRQQEAIGTKIETLSDRLAEGKLSRSEFEAARADLAAQKTKMEALSEQSHRLAAVMEQQSQAMREAQKPMAELSRQMQALSKPMESIGRDMEVVGKQIEQASRESDRKIQSLIDDALRSGKAVPIDGVLL